jgi:hypothetical protein
MKRDSVVSALYLAVVLAFGGMVLAAGLGREHEPAHNGVAACQGERGCDAQPRHGWMRAENARRFASVFRE